MDTNFKKELIRKFEDKKLANSSIKTYVRNLEKLNGDNPLKNLKFLENVDDILKKIEKYKDNTKRMYIISICSSLSCFDLENKKNKKVYDTYFKLLTDSNNKLKSEEAKNEKSENQKKNWIEWNEVEGKWSQLENEVNSFKKEKSINESKFNTLLRWVILSLYVLKQPRRNEYMKMNIVKKWNSSMDETINYLSLDDKKFIFNVFKTSKKEGQQIQDIPEKLWNVISTYIKYHPLLKGKIKNGVSIPFLVYYSGSPLKDVNAITRILNSIFGKKVGSSMLRHIFLSNKYGDINEEQKQDAEAMGHSVKQQRDYIKN